MNTHTICRWLGLPLALSLTFARADIFVQFTGDAATFDPNGNMTDAHGNAYAFVYKGVPRPPWVRLPWSSPSQFYNGHHAIGLEILPTGSPVPANDDGTDKANLTIAKVSLGQDYFLGFAMKLSRRHFDDPTAEILLQQWWQGSPYSPPVSLHMIPNSGYQCEFQVRNNATGGNPNAQVIHLPLGKCRPGMWHTFIVRVRTHYLGQPGTGQLTVWHHDMIRSVIDWTGDIGYDPSQPVRVNGTGNYQSTANPNPVLVTYYGPYRDHQETDQQAFFSNITLASSQCEADPTLW